ncbi:MAG: hypothetical protein LUC60_05695 [Lachnospiraceae bacterium]|nr:hypothetical protein [Lachnospiraceae bacterium]
MGITIKSADSPDLEELLRWREIVLREVFSIPMKENMDDLLATNRQYYLSALERREHIACFAQTEGYLKYTKEDTPLLGGI